MSLSLSNIVQWVLHSQVVEQAKKEALRELSESAQKFLGSVKSHAPDMADQVERKVTDAFTDAVTGALTRK